MEMTKTSASMEDWDMSREDIEEELENYSEHEPHSGFCRECPEENICMVTTNRDDRLLTCTLFAYRVASEAGFDEKIKKLMKGEAKVVEVENK